MYLRLSVEDLCMLPRLPKCLDGIVHKQKISICSLSMFSAEIGKIRVWQSGKMCEIYVDRKCCKCYDFVPSIDVPVLTHDIELSSIYCV